MYSKNIKFIKPEYEAPQIKIVGFHVECGFQGSPAPVERATNDVRTENVEQIDNSSNFSYDLNYSF